MSELPLFLCALFSGALIGWLLRAGRRSPADARVEEDLREQIRLRDEELKALRVKAASAEAAEAAAWAGRKAVETTLAESRQERDAARAEGVALRGDAEALRRDRALMEDRTKNLEEKLASEKKAIESLQQRFSKEFEAVSNKLLLENAGHFDRRSSESLDKVLTPLRQGLADFKLSLEAVRKETGENSVLLKDQVGRISREAAALAQALKGDVKVLGNWGEGMLDQILEKSGLQRDIHYRRQQGARDADNGAQVLDVIVDLPEGRSLIIDSKVSLRSYEEAANCADEAARAALLDRHVEAIRRHFRDLGKRRYPETQGGGSPDFVLMYIPVEGAYFAGVARDPGLISEALDNQVVLITNSTLLATLRTVAHVWNLSQQQKNSKQIAERGARLYDKFVGFVKDLEDVGSAIERAGKAWEAASGKLSKGPGNLVRQAEQLRTLGVQPSKSLPRPLLAEEGGEEDGVPEDGDDGSVQASTAGAPARAADPDDGP